VGDQREEYPPCGHFRVTSKPKPYYAACKPPCSTGAALARLSFAALARLRTPAMEIGRQSLVEERLHIALKLRMVATGNNFTLSVARNGSKCDPASCDKVLAPIHNAANRAQKSHLERHKHKPTRKAGSPPWAEGCLQGSKRAGNDHDSWHLANHAQVPC